MTSKAFGLAQLGNDYDGATGDFTTTGTVTATAFAGDGSGLTGVGGVAFTWSGEKQLNTTHTGMSGAREIVILIDDLISVDSLTFFVLQIGDSGGIENSGYDGHSFRFGQTNTNASINSYAWMPGGADYNQGYSAAGMVLLHSPNGTFWTINSFIATRDSSYKRQEVLVGSKTLTAELDRVHLADFLYNSHGGGNWRVGWR